MTRKQRRQYAAQLRALAGSDLNLADLGQLEGGATCDCTGCRLIRAGLCLSCAALVHAQILESRAGDTITPALCSASCREGLERYVAERVAP
jgi:hypothetical protein